MNNEYIAITRNREGCKYKYLEYLIPLMPDHKYYLEPFVGTGVVFFNKELAKFNTINDSSEFIYKLWTCMYRNPDKLLERLINFVVSEKAFKEYKCKDDYEYVAKYLLWHQVGLYGSLNTIKVGGHYTKKYLIKQFNKYKNKIQEYLNSVNILNRDVFDLLNKYSVKEKDNPNDVFVYCDPPYSINKGYLKDNKGWDIRKLEDMISILINKRYKFMISEYYSKEIQELSTKYRLKLTSISKSKGMNLSKGNNVDEIVLLNYSIKTLF